MRVFPASVCELCKDSVCTYWCERVWNVATATENNNTYTTTPHLHTPVNPVNPKRTAKNVASCRLLFIVVALCHSLERSGIVVGVEKLPWASHRPRWQHCRIHPWLNAPANLATTRAHVYTHKQKHAREGNQRQHTSLQSEKRCFLCPSVARESFLSRKFDETRVFFLLFFFYFCCY